MNKKRNTRIVNKYSLGSRLAKWNTNVTNSMFTNDKGKLTDFGEFAKGFGINGGNIGGITNTVISLAGKALAGNNTTAVGNAMQSIGSLASNIPGIGGLIGAGVNLLGGITNAAFGSNLNENFIAQTESDINQQSNYLSGASTNAQLMSDFANLTFLDKVKKSDVGTEGWFSDKATDKTNALNEGIATANMRALASLANTAENIDRQNDLMLMANYSAHGGKIHIKPENRGKFTEYCGGKVTSECIAKGKRSSDPAVRKRATFAANARKWKHDDGGFLSSNGADWSNGVTIIGNGDTHENNKYEGVQIGVDAEGIPNLVEEGEVIFNDYVFSNRLNVPNSVRSKYKLRGNNTLTFADAAKQLQKESEERPNDPISKRGLEDAMLKLQGEQEVIRQKKDRKGSKNKFEYGGYPLIDVDLPLASVDAINKRISEDVNTNPFYQNLRKESKNIFTTDRMARGNDYDTPKDNWLRYAPVAGSVIGLGYDLLSKPDYSSADAVMNAADAIGNYTPASFTPISNYLEYNPLDRDYYLNKLDASNAATKRQIRNTAGGNRAAMLTGLLAADREYGNQLGSLARQAEEYNTAQRQAVETFNRATNQANAEMGLKAAMANAELAQKAKSARAEGIARAVAMRDEINARRSASISANLTNLFDSLGNIGIDEMNRAARDMLIRAGVFGTLSEKPQGWSNERWENYKKTISGEGYSRGGQLKKKRGGFTY